MDAHYKKVWVDALQGGAYVQTTGILKEGPAFCCLGVLCDVSGLGKWDEDNVYTLDIDEVRFHPDSIRLPVEFGLESHEARCLSEMNDSGSDFCEIASFIESNY